MLSHRNGQLVTVCDGCYRPKHSNDTGWYVEHVPGAAASQPRNGVAGAPVVKLRQADRTIDTCPDCQPETAA